MKVPALSALSLLSILWGVVQGAEPIALSPEFARLENCELESKYGPANIGNSKGRLMGVSWDINVPDAGKYVVEIVFSCEESSALGKFEIQSGHSMMEWTSHTTAGWNFFQKRQIGTIDLKKGKQTFSFKGKERKAVAIRSMRLIPAPGTIVSLREDGYTVLDGDSANLDGTYQDKDGLICGMSNGSEISWNLSSPAEKKMGVVFVYGAPGKPGETCEFEVKAGNGSYKAVLPVSGGWRNTREHESGMVTIPEGMSKLSVIKRNGSVDLKEVRLAYSEKLEAAVKALREKPRLGMSLSDLEKVWGSSSPGGPFNIERRGGKDDVDGASFSGLVSHVKTAFWDKGGMKITAALLKDRCIALNIDMPDKSLKTAREVVSILMPGVPFDWGKNETSYSSDKAYKMQYWGNTFDIKASALVRDLRGDIGKSEDDSQHQMETAGKGYFYMGRTLDELKNLWGQGEIRDGSNIELRGDKNDIDWELYKEIKPDTMAYRWRYPQRDNLHITAVFWRNRCIALDVSKIGGFSSRELKDKVNEFIPGVVFSGIPQEKGERFTIYSTSHKRGYKLQNWGGYFELKASGLIREMLQEHEDELKSSAVIVYKKLQAIQKEKKTSLFGKTPAEVDALLGPSEAKGVFYKKKPIRVWKFPGSSIELMGAFGSLGEREVCCHLLVVDRQKGLVSQLAFPLVQQAVAPFSLKGVAKDDMKTWFSTTSREQGERFFVEWYNDPNTRATMCITDMVALRAWEQAEVKRKDREKEKTFDKVKQTL